MSRKKKTAQKKAAPIFGIYQILNVETGHGYIGSAYDIEDRFKGHIKDLIRGVHAGTLMQQEFFDNVEKGNTILPCGFKLSILEECSVENREERENYYLHNDWFDSTYNTQTTAVRVRGSIAKKRHEGKMRAAGEESF